MRMLIFRFDEVDSTNAVARNYPTNSVIVAARQTSGKGRFGREWVSNEGGIWMSVVVNLERRAFEYTFIASIAVLKVISVGGIKWPNDIVYEDKKVCGILTEIVSQGSKSKVIIGIGVNVNNMIEGGLEDFAISLSSITGKKYDLDILVNRIILNIEELNKNDFKKISSEYKKSCSILHKEVKVKTISKVISGKAVDIDGDGNLVLETETGRIALNEGDVSLI